MGGRPVVSHFTQIPGPNPILRPGPEGSWASGDGLVCDTADAAAFALPCRPGETVRATFELPAPPRFAKCLVSNPDPNAAVTHQARDVGHTDFWLHASPFPYLARSSEVWYNGGKGGGAGMVARVSGKGQITLSAAARRQLGIAPNSQVEVIVKDGEITIRPLKGVSELAGILSRYARPGTSEDWNAIREQTEKAVAEEVAGAHARRVRRGR